jgi:hypothetical protein
MPTPEPAQPTDALVTQRARLHTLRQRRRRLWQRIATLTFVTIAMVLVVLLNRDTQHLREFRRRGQLVAAALQQEFENRGAPPLMVPSGRGRVEEEVLEQERKRHYFNMLYVRQREQHPERKVGACCLEQPVRFFLRTEGRIMILFDGERFESTWMPEDEFRAQAEQLGFGDLLTE